MKSAVTEVFCLAIAAALTMPVQGAQPASVPPFIVQAESGKFTGIIDRHSCWHNVMLTDAPHSTLSGTALVDTKNEVGSYVEVDYVATWGGPHHIAARYTHHREDVRPGELLVNGRSVATLTMPATIALPAFKTDSVVVTLQSGTNVLRLRATAAGGLPNMDYLKVAEIRDVSSDSLSRIQVLEVEDGRYTGKLDHHSCWNFIAQTQALHSGFTGEGYRRLTILLQREGWKAGRLGSGGCIGCIARKTCWCGPKTRRKRVARIRVPLAGAERPNQRWSMDFMSNRLADGRAFRVLTVVDSSAGSVRCWKRTDR